MTRKDMRFYLFIGLVSGFILSGCFSLYQVDPIDWFQEVDDD